MKKVKATDFMSAVLGYAAIVREEKDGTTERKIKERTEKKTTELFGHLDIDAMTAEIMESWTL